MGLQDKNLHRRWGSGIKMERWGLGDDEDQAQKVVREVVAKNSRSKNRNQAGQGRGSNYV